MSTNRYPGEPHNERTFLEPQVHEALKNPVAGLHFPYNSIPSDRVKWLDDSVPSAAMEFAAESVPVDAIEWTAAEPSTTDVAWGELGYAQVTANQTTITTEADLTSLTTTVTVGTDRKIKITGNGIFTRTVADGVTQFRIKEGTTTLQIANIRNASTAGETCQAICRLDDTVATAGSHTYKLTLALATGTGSVGLTASSTNPAFILVEDLGPA